MLKLNISNKRSPPVVTLPLTKTTDTVLSKGGVVYQEFQRRDTIVKTLARDCPYGIGDTVKPVNHLNKHKYPGTWTVATICDKYMYMKDDEWPSSDNPLIVEVFTSEGVNFYCTTNYLEKE